MLLSVELPTRCTGPGKTPQLCPEQAPTCLRPGDPWVSPTKSHATGLAEIYVVPLHCHSIMIMIMIMTIIIFLLFVC